MLVSEDHNRGSGGEVVEGLGGQLPEFVRGGVCDLLDDELPVPDGAGRAGEPLGMSPQLGGA
ncbi:glutamate-cysteine ligase [Streptomyces laurentii]|uniref:Glutamate-cysteine ligase n=1 Tax=Streptomyces laurentii TaxID=39478 RepID=A0A160NYP5_STRLU|nr:glutamate-cysteine ligase [Streptomyces laurentii]